MSMDDLKKLKQQFFIQNNFYINYLQYNIIYNIIIFYNIL